MLSIIATLSVALIPTSVSAQPSDSRAEGNIAGAGVAARAATVARMRGLSAAVEGVRVGGPLQRAVSRDSLLNGAVIGAAIGAVTLGTLAATVCHVHRERGGPSCAPEAIRFAAIGGAIGLGAGVAIDVAQSSGPIVRVTIAF